MKQKYFKYIEFRIRNMPAGKSSIFLAKSKLSMAQKKRLLMDKGISKSEVDLCYSLDRGY